MSEEQTLNQETQETEIQEAEVVEEATTETTPEVQTQEQQQETIEVDANTAFQLKLQEFDKNIAIAEAQVADLKKQKMTFVYDQNVQIVADNYKANMIKQQVEQEAVERMKSKEG